jgi:hypothetical protein
LERVEPLAQNVAREEHCRSGIDRGDDRQHPALCGGTRVSVVLDGKAFGAAADENAETIPFLKQNNIRVHLTANPHHLKAAIIDGSRLSLSDRNCTTRSKAEVVVLDRYPNDRAIVERAMLGVPGGNDHLWTRKGDAVAAEANLLV